MKEIRAIQQAIDQLLEKKQIRWQWAGVGRPDSITCRGFVDPVALSDNGFVTLSALLSLAHSHPPSIHPLHGLTASLAHNAASSWACAAAFDADLEHDNCNHTFFSFRRRKDQMSDKISKYPSATFEGA
ncbi:hypothetical protein J6590_011990 [Homalodisca vitripennis]|nr:hypothetical protein J6590_011990 [Homalodisca vitripennis]